MSDRETVALIQALRRMQVELWAWYAILVLICAASWVVAQAMLLVMGLADRWLA